MPDGNMIGSSKAAEILRMSPRRVGQLCSEGRLEGARKIGRNWFVPEESVLALIEKKDSGRKRKAAKKETRLPCAVGSTSYREIREESYYVDKTLLIRDLIDDRNTVTLFTRPRRFGKTLALNMIRTFFEKTQEDTSVYFKDMNIWRCGEKYTRQQGKYPVVWLTFKDVKFNNWKDSMEAFCLVLKDEYKRHAELSDNPELDEDDRAYYSRMIRKELSPVEYTRSLLILTRMMKKVHDTDVVILIDEYDTPIQQGYSCGFYEDVIAFMRNFLSGGLKDNENLAFSVLTGILRISKENLFSGLNNLTVNTVIDRKYSEYFGFTRKEVNALADYYGKAEKIGEIKDWYDGYLFGNTEIFNPWSVMNYFSNNSQPKAFWANTSDNAVIREILKNITPEISKELTLLLRGETIYTFLDMEVLYPRLADEPEHILSFLLVAGYLKLAEPVLETETGTYGVLALPNKEVRRVYRTEIAGWLRRLASGSVVSGIENALMKNDGESLQRNLQLFMLRSVSSFDGAAEGFYHGMVLGLTAVMAGRYRIRSNREAGEGRFDLQMEPEAPQFPGIIMEFKAVRKGERVSLEEKALEALKQIEDRKYDTDLKEKGCRTIYRYGIAFCGKDVAVETK